MVSGPATAALLAGLAVALVGMLVVGVALGTVTVSPGRVWTVVWAHLAGSTRGLDSLDDQIVWGIRAPRVLLSAVVGAALAVAGTCLQALVRNPLADPYILGVAAGASLGASLVLAFGSGVVLGLGVAGAAFGGSIISLVLVFVLAQSSGRLADTRLVLSGVAIAYMGTAATSWVQLHANPSQLRGIMFWLMGSVAGATWHDLGIPTVTMLASTVWLTLRSRSLNALVAGDDTASGLGVDVHRLRLELLAIGSLLTATSVSVAGGIGFVGLMVPHMTRFIVGADHRRVLPVSALLGAVFLVIVDLLTRIIDKPNEIPLGILTAAAGGPFFVWLLRRRATAGS